MFSAFAREVEKLSAGKSNFSVPQGRRGRRSMSVDTMLRKDSEGTLLRHKLGESSGQSAVGIEVTNGKKRILREDEAIDKLHAVQRELPIPNAVFRGLEGLFDGDKVAAEHEDLIPGGLADYGDPEQYDQRQLNMGIGVELEHTDNKALAKEIAMDHLHEIKDYYTRLKRMESEASSEEDAAEEKRAAGALEAYMPWYGAAAGGTGGALLGEKLVPARLRTVGMLGGTLLGTGLGLHSSEALGKALDKKLSKEAWAKLADSSKAQWLEIPYTEGERTMQNVPVQSKKKAGDAPNVDSDSMNGPSRYDDGWSPPTSALTVKAGAMLRAVERTLLGDDGFGDAPDREVPTPNRIQHQVDKNYFVGSAPDARPITEVESDGAYSRD